MGTRDRNALDVEAILNDLYASKINASISWVWDGGIDVKLGDPLNGYKAEDKVSTFAEAAAWLRDQACTRYPDSEFARKYGDFRLIRG
jgi:predicted RNA-binding Zn ribbon-like protein